MLQKILSIDIGGTNSRFAHFELEDDNIKLCDVYTCKTNILHDTATTLELASNCGLSPYIADIQVWGIAGIVEQDKFRASLTNGSLKLDFNDFLKKQKPKKFIILNDFALQAWACTVPTLKTLSIKHKHAIRFANRGILGAGTGLGTAAIIPMKNSWVVMQSEGGHTEMPIQTKQEEDFAHFAKHYLGQERFSAEDILAAKGMSLLHAYEFSDNLSPMDIAALWKKTPSCLAANLYAGFLGRFCRHWALNTLCLGGLYLGGGVLSKNPEILQNPYFEQEFYLSPMDIINNIPITLMIHENASLWGGAYAAKHLAT